MSGLYCDHLVRVLRPSPHLDLLQNCSPGGKCEEFIYIQYTYQAPKLTFYHAQLNSTEHESKTVPKYLNSKNLSRIFRFGFNHKSQSFILLTNVKMPNIVGILTICEQDQSHAHLGRAWKTSSAKKKTFYNPNVDLVKTRKSALRGTYTPGWCPFLSINIF